MKMINPMTASAALLAVVCIASGCQSGSSERARNAEKYFEAAAAKVQFENKRLVLSECIALAKEKNLAAKVSGLEAKIAGEKESAEVMGMLPALDSNKNETMDADVAQGVLDFALAFLNDKTAKDRSSLKEQRQQRAAQNQALDVIRAYYACAAAQRAVDIAKVRLKQAGDPEQAKAGSAQYSKFKDLEKKLSDYIAMKEKAIVELCDLIGVVPSATILVDDNCLSTVPAFKFGEVDQLEKTALNLRPELYSGAKERNFYMIRKEAKVLFPQIGIYFNYSDSHIYNLNWWTFGIRAAYNLLAGAFDADKLKGKCGYPQALAVVAQVRIAHADLNNARKAYEFDTKAGSAREIERVFSLAAYHVASYRLVNAIGLASIGARNAAVTVDENASAMKRAAAELEVADREFKRQVATASRQAKTDDLREIEAKVVNQSLTDFGAVDFFSVYDTTPAKAAQAGQGKK